MNNNLDDANTLRGISQIINERNAKTGINFEELEQKFIHDNTTVVVKKDLSEQFNAELKQLARNLNVPFDSTPIKNKNTPNLHVQTPKKQPLVSPRINTSLLKEVNSAPSPYRQHSASREITPKRNSPKYKSPIYEREEDSRSPSPRNSDDEASPPPSPMKSNYQPFSPETEFGKRTVEEERHNQIREVLGDFRNQNTKNGKIFDIEKDMQDDLKSSMLEEIDFLKTTLKDEEVDLSQVPPVDRNSSFADIENVLRILRSKNDRIRCTTLAEEAILFGVYGLEELFNGDRTYFGKFKPDLRDWNKQVQVKLKRMRYDTSSLVSGILREYNVGSLGRIMMELVPNMVVYSHNRKQQYGKPTLGDDPDISEALNNLRDINP